MDYKYSAVADWIRQKIEVGEYKPGGKLPSVQGLAEKMSCNADTVVKAYRQLEAEHLVYAVPKSGFYVLKNKPALKVGGSLDMASMRPPAAINPYKDYYHCMEKASVLYRQRLFEYAPTQGMPELVQALAKHLTNFRIFTRPENVFVTSGAQQALYILAAMPFAGGGGKVVVEQPTYSVMLDVLRFAKVPVIGVRRTDRGLDLDELAAIFAQGDIKFFYTMPRYQNPTGFCYDESQKKAILKIAEQYGVYIVEDDYLADLETDGKADPLFACGAQQSVIYIQSFSKTLLPGLRLGMCLLPPQLHQAFLAGKRSVDLATPVITQAALEIFLKSKMYTHHVQRVKRFYRQKMTVLRQACQESAMGEACWHIPATGIYAYLESSRWPADELVRRLVERGLLVSGVDGCYIPGYDHTGGLRLCVCNASDEELRGAVAMIEQELSKLDQ